jgi:hypothetical protein
MQTGSSGTLIGWKSGQTTFVPLWDRMEGAWLRTRVMLLMQLLFLKINQFSALLVHLSFLLFLIQPRVTVPLQLSDF